MEMSPKPMSSCSVHLAPYGSPILVASPAYLAPEATLHHPQVQPPQPPPAGMLFLHLPSNPATLLALPPTSSPWNDGALNLP